MFLDLNKISCTLLYIIEIFNYLYTLSLFITTKISCKIWLQFSNNKITKPQLYRLLYTVKIDIFSLVSVLFRKGSDTFSRGEVKKPIQPVWNPSKGYEKYSVPQKKWGLRKSLNFALFLPFKGLLIHFFSIAF